MLGYLLCIFQSCSCYLELIVCGSQYFWILLLSLCVGRSLLCCLSLRGGTVARLFLLSCAWPTFVELPVWMPKSCKAVAVTVATCQWAWVTLLLGCCSLFGFVRGSSCIPHQPVCWSRLQSSVCCHGWVSATMRLLLEQFPACCGTAVELCLLVGNC